MGNKSVSSTQYDKAQMELGSRVKVLHEDSTFFFKPTTLFIEEPKDSHNMRQRRNEQDSQVTSGDNCRLEKSMSELLVSQTFQKDPLKWFGILLPQSLKECQMKFKKAAELSCKTASLRSKYLTLQQKYRDLKQVKRQIMEESAEISDLSANLE